MKSLGFGKILREIRIKNNISQRELAEIVGCGQSAICKLENGTSEISIETFVKIAEHLNVSPAYLLEHRGHQVIENNEKQEQFKTRAEELKNEFDYKGLEALIQENEGEEFLEISFMQKMILRFKGVCAYYNLKKDALAFRYLEQALKKKAQSIQDHYQNIETHTSIGIIHYEQENYSLAMRSFEKARVIAKRYTTIRSDKIYIRVLYNASLVNSHMGNHRKAFRHLNEAIKINREAHSSFIMHVLYYQKAYSYNKLEDVKNCERCLEISKKLAEAFDIKTYLPFTDAMTFVVEMNKTGRWERNGKWLIDYKNNDIFNLYTIHIEETRKDISEEVLGDLEIEIEFPNMAGSNKSRDEVQLKLTKR